jgi:hypothetical protein
MLDFIPALINKTFPIPAKYRSKLPGDIVELSRLLTNKRGERSLSYLTRPNLLSAYLHYFLPWNLYRLCLLLPTLDISLSDGGTITDLGCGPLTFTSALWISRPELRSLKLEINCIDRSSPVLEAGKKFFNALCGSNSAGSAAAIEENAWKINLIKDDIDIRRVKKSANKRKQANLVCAVNMFNEIYENISHNNKEELRLMAEKAAHYMNSEALADASILTIEPGVPQSGKFISLLRNELIKLNRLPSSPCTHSGSCPFMGKTADTIRGRNWIDTKKRWCHFAFEAYDTPKELLKLSAAAKLPKDRLVLSYLYTKSITEKVHTKALRTSGSRQGGYGKHSESTDARVLSDPFQLPENRYGRYGCSDKGLILIIGEKNRIEELKSHNFVKNVYRNDTETKKREYDKKSGALIIEAGD